MTPYILGKQKHPVEDACNQRIERAFFATKPFVRMKFSSVATVSQTRAYPNEPAWGAHLKICFSNEHNSSTIAWETFDHKTIETMPLATNIANLFAVALYNSGSATPDQKKTTDRYVRRI